MLCLLRCTDSRLQPQLIAEQLTRPGGLKAELLAEFVAQLAENDPDDLKQTLAPAVAHIAESVKHGGDDFGAAMAAIAPILELAQHKIMRPVIASVSNCESSSSLSSGRASLGLPFSVVKPHPGPKLCSQSSVFLGGSVACAAHLLRVPARSFFAFLRGP